MVLANKISLVVFDFDGVMTDNGVWLDQNGMELWVAEADGQIVSAGRLEPVSGTDFAGIWGGATRPMT